MGVLGGLLAGLLVLGLVLGAVLGWISALSLSSLRARLGHLERELQRLQGRMGDDIGPVVPVAGGTGAARQASPHAPPPPASPAVATAARSVPVPAPRSRRGFDRTSLVSVLTRIRDHWMVWLGGFSIGLAGVFLVRFSIEQGYLGPTARVLLGMAAGVALHVLAEWLRRRVRGRYDAVAALAGGASITLYAAALAALHLYQLWPPLVTFALLALISMGTMVLALHHGPVLAILGILGAFAVPALIGGEADQLLTILGYSLVVAMAGFVLMRYVYRDWLWWGTVAGALFWWWIALHAGGYTDPFLGLYLGALAWSMLALRSRNYWLTREDSEPGGAAGWRRWLQLTGTGQANARVGLLALLAAQAYSIAGDPQWSSGPLIWLPLPAVILLAGRYNRSLRALPWLALAFVSLGLIASLFHWQPLQAPPWSIAPVDLADRRNALLSLTVLAVLFGGGGAWHLWARRDSAAAASLAFLAPLVALALAYVLAPDALPRWGLSALSLLAGLILGGLAAKRLAGGRVDAIAFWQITAGHLGYSLAAVISFESATLTLALAVQVLSLTWLMRRFAVRYLDWLVKLVLTVILFRLTLNPWLPLYGAGTHWTLWTYGGSLLMVWIASRLLADGERLKLWLQGASVHLLVLFLHTEMRYWLYAGEIFSPRYEFLEAALNTCLWAALAMIYFWRSGLSAASRPLYRTLAQLLMLLAVGNYLLLLTVLNPLWGAVSQEAISSTLIFNELLLAYGLPVLLWTLASRYFEPDLRPFFAMLAGVGLWLFVSLQIRHLWQGQLDLANAVIGGELYTYSVVWLLMAAGLMMAGTLRGRLAVYRGGLALLVLVILKIFFVDMGGLTGLLRALSFMGLGLCLLGLAFAHQYLQRRAGNSRAG